MPERSAISPSDAEAVVEQRIEAFGTGSLPHVDVAELGDGTWRVRWDHREQVVAPMNRTEWCAWLDENVGSLDASDLMTTES